MSLWRENCPELREAESRRGQKAVQIAWQDQIQHKEKVSRTLGRVLNDVISGQCVFKA